MAEQEFYVSTERMCLLIDEFIASGGKIASRADVSSGEIQFIFSSEDFFDRKISQAFLKHPMFSNMEYQSKLIGNIHSGKIYITDQSYGDGHLEMRPHSHDRSSKNMLVSISYRSFYVNEFGAFMPPSEPLKNAYKKMTASLRRGMVAFEVFRGRKIYIDKNMLSPDTKREIGLYFGLDGTANETV